MRGILVVGSLLVLAAGCSQSAPTLDAVESSVASLPGMSKFQDQPRSSIEQDSDVREIKASEKTISSTSLSSRYEATPELTANIVRLLDVAVNSCGDIPEPGCSGAVWKACDGIQEYWQSKKPREEQEWEDWTEEQKGISEVMRLVCLAADIVRYSELASVLSSKYGAEFYALGHFTSFRNLQYNDISRMSDEITAKGDELVDTFGMSDETVRILISLMGKINQYYELEKSRIDMRSAEEAGLILDLHSLDSVDIICPTLVFDFLDNSLDFERKAERCIEEMCSSNSYATICSPSQRIDYAVESAGSPQYMTNLERSATATILEDLTIARVEIYWAMMSLVCANAEIEPSSPDDKCRQLAALICSKLANYSYSYVGSTHLSRIKATACALGIHYSVWDRILARRACFEAIAELKMSQDSLFTPKNDCSIEMQECENNSSAYQDATGRDSFDEGNCEALSEYYNYEISWKKLPSDCLDDTVKVDEFITSDCFSEIENLCNHRINGAARRVPYEFYYRYYFEIKRGFCSLNLPVYSYRQFRNDNLTSDDSQKLHILSLLDELPDIHMLLALGIVPVSNPNNAVYSLLTDENLNSIVGANEICRTAAYSPVASECASTLWVACYNLRSGVAESEHPDSEVSSTIAYLCSAAYIAELAELASAIFSSFINDYQEGNFDEFRKFLTDEIFRKDAYFSVEDTGIQINSDLEANLRNGTQEALRSLGESLGQFILPLLLADETDN